MSSAPHLQDKTLTFILAGGEGERLYPLTADQPKPVVPFGGLFRIIDFTLSNVLNSGLRRIYVLTQYKHERLHSYVRDGWTQLSNAFQQAGEEIMCLPPSGGKRYRGPADAVFQNLETIERSSAEYILIVSGDQVYHMDYGELLHRHVSSGADVTAASVKKPVSTRPLQANPENVLTNIGVYVFGKETLIEALRENAELPDSDDFEKIILPGLSRSARVEVFEFDGYWHDVATLDGYYQTNLDLLLTGPGLDPYENAVWPTRTLAGPRSLQRSWLASNSRVCQDATLNECEVWMSIVSTGAWVDANAELESAIVLPGAHIGSGAKIRNAIVAEKAVVSANARIGYDIEADRSRFLVSKNGIVIVGSSIHDRPRVPQQTHRAVRARRSMMLVPRLEK
jgi:glucose-1-phosphate adenylyltransferase